jgi:1-acyl-sn-glycerol-3-phosphate acyltransferase
MKINMDFAEQLYTFRQRVMSLKPRDIRPLYYTYQIYKYLFVFPLFAAGTLLFGTLAAVLAVFINQKIGSLMGVIWARFSCLIIPMTVKVIGRENADPGHSYIVIANHQSQTDIFAIYGWLPFDFKWVMKMELRTAPVIGYACHKLGHVFIDRSNSEAARKSINAAKKNIAVGTSIVFFPEGTRSDDGRLNEFKKGAFHLALEMGLPILPVTIIGTRDVLPNRSTGLFPGRALMIIHEPVSIDGYDEKNIPELIARTREIIDRPLRQETYS